MFLQEKKLLLEIYQAQIFMINNVVGVATRATELRKFIFHEKLIINILMVFLKGSDPEKNQWQQCITKKL